MSRHPTLKWAQRDDLLFITIDLPDAKEVKLKLEPEGKFFFSATSGSDNIPYQIDINLYDKVDVNESKYSIGSRNIVYLVKKEETKWWSRLLKQEGRTPVFIKVDWDKWVDEDEQDEKGLFFSHICCYHEDEDEDDSDTGEYVEEEKQSVEEQTVSQVEGEKLKL
ncbi:hypothetical protein OSB04_005759 [Centaurea solstitialis]|uniref:Co-chaperone protein p23 n=1 Tax=Centaurea solstitialis TaxID=347529 RepID=A0AA38WRM4_9ASTR|nr:hypothetical protein OSB04_005759 [Centaurea solstitialis]